MRLPAWVHHPGTAVRSMIPTKQDIINVCVTNLSYVVGVYIIAVGVLYLGQGVWKIPTLTETQESVIVYGSLALGGGYLLESKIEEIRSDENQLILQPLKPWENSHYSPWKVPDTVASDMDVAGGELNPIPSPWGRVAFVVDYDPEENRAVAAWDGALSPQEARAAVWLIIDNYKEQAKDAGRYRTLRRIFPALVSSEAGKVEEGITETMRGALMPDFLENAQDMQGWSPGDLDDALDNSMREMTSSASQSEDLDLHGMFDEAATPDDIEDVAEKLRNGSDKEKTEANP